MRAAGVVARGWGWRHAGRARWAVHDLDLDIAAGERVLLLGPSGGGKSTLLAGLAGLLAEHDSGESAGSLLVDGAPAHEGRHRAGLLLQDPDSQLVMSRAGDDVAFGPENLGVPAEQIWSRVDEALELVGFPYGRDRLTCALSGGEKQRLALAGVVALRPGLLLLDEPTANLDPDGAALVRAAVRQVLDATGATAIVVEHRVAPWLDLLDRVVVLDRDGGLLADGPAQRVLPAHADALRAAGVWLPASAPAMSRGRATGGGVLVRVRGAALTYRAAGRAALAASSLDLRSGEIVAVTGPNGSGKSTLATVVAGLARPTEGDAVGTDDPRSLHRRRARSLVRLVGTVFQDPEHQFVTRTVRAELELAPRRLGRADTAARTDDLLERLRLTRLAAANPFTLSGGEKRRLSVAGALSAAPPLLVLDEPTFGQDATTWAEVVELLAAARNDGCGQLIVSHDEELVAALADRVVPMRDGVLGDPVAIPVGDVGP